MSFGRMRNNTLPTNKIKLESQKDSGSKFDLDIIERMNLDKFVKNTLETGKKIGGGIVNAPVGAFKGFHKGTESGIQTFQTFWSNAHLDFLRTEYGSKKVEPPITKKQFELQKENKLPYNLPFYRDLKIADEYLATGYDEYVRRHMEEATVKREEFTKELEQKVISKKEQLASTDDRALELIDEYGVSAMLGYGLGQMMSNPNEAIPTVIATAMGGALAKTGQPIIGGLVDLSEAVMSNVVTERIIADAKNEEVDTMEIVNRTGIAMLFMRGLGELANRANQGRINRKQAKVLKRAENVMAEEVVTARTMEDAVDRGLTTDVAQDNAVILDYKDVRASEFTEKVGKDHYKDYVIKKTAEDFAYDEATNKGLSENNKLMLTKSRKKAEKGLRELLHKEYGDDYSFEQYIADMDNAYANQQVAQVEGTMKMNPKYTISNEDVAKHVDEAEFLENQDVSMLNTIDSEFEETREVLGKSDTEIRDWFDSNC